jgi:hypothetical protein
VIAVTSLLPRIIAFVVSAFLGFVVASVVVGAMQDRAPQSTAGAAPEYLLAGADTPLAGDTPAIAAFDVEPVSEAEPLAPLDPGDLSAAAAAILGAGEPGQGVEPAMFKDPTGFPRIDPITQFDGGPFQGSNCTLASGSMLARLAFGIVTNGSVLRTLQDDQDGGTGLNDLKAALWRGYGVSAPTGLLRPQQLKDLLANGYGAVIQGIYGEIPAGLRLQKDFTGGHAIYLDGYYPGNAKRGIPEAYYVIDPLGRPHSGYKGEWWPASIVDAFGTAFGGGRIPAMWAFPPGGVPPDVVGPDVVPIPADASGPSGPGSTAKPSESAPPSVDPGATPGPVPSGFAPAEPGDIGLEIADPPAPPVSGGLRDGIRVSPVFDICIVSPSLPGCPTGLEAIFPAGERPLLQFKLGPTVNVVFVDSDRANKAIVGFTVDPPTTSDVKFWVQGESPASVHTASSMTSVTLFGTPMILAELEVQAATTYNFQAVAGSGIFAGSSAIGSFTTGSGVKTFEVSLAAVASPVFKAGTGLSPFSHLAADAFLRPMIRLDQLAGASCDESASFGGAGFCLDQEPLVAASSTCTSAKVTYELVGIGEDSVAVRAYPTEAGVTPDGGLTLDGVLEATGPAGSGTVAVGCLASGLSYSIVIDGIGDDRGPLASTTVTVP